MSDVVNALQPAIDVLEQDLADLERQANGLLTSINVLRARAGLPPRVTRRLSDGSDCREADATVQAQATHPPPEPRSPATARRRGEGGSAPRTTYRPDRLCNAIASRPTRYSAQSVGSQPSSVATKWAVAPGAPTGSNPGPEP